MKNLNNNLCKDIISSDFFLITKNTKKHALKVISLLKEVKQFLRILNFLKNLEKSVVFFNLDKNKASFLISQGLSKLNNPIFKLYNKTSQLKVKDKIFKTNIFLDFVKLRNKSKVQKFLNEKINIIVQISHLIKRSSFYSLRNTMDTFKKYIFLVSLIQKVFK